MPKSPDPAAFEGFAPDALGFFDELDAQQTREWFLAHKDRYERTIRDPLGRLVGSLSLALAAHDIPLTGDARTSLFRINRDVRFSRDKRPYKTSASAALTRDGTRRAQGVLYVQLGARDCFAAAGFHGPEPDQLEAMRRHILDDPARWADAGRSLGEAGLSLSRHDAAVRLPRGYDRDAVGALGDAIRLKSFVVVQALAPADIATPALIDRLVQLASAATPLLRFGWSALAERRRAP